MESGWLYVQVGTQWGTCKILNAGFFYHAFLEDQIGKILRYVEFFLENP